MDTKPLNYKKCGNCGGSLAKIYHRKVDDEGRVSAEMETEWICPVCEAEHYQEVSLTQLAINSLFANAPDTWSCPCSPQELLPLFLRCPKCAIRKGTAAYQSEQARLLRNEQPLPPYSPTGVFYTGDTFESTGEPQTDSEILPAPSEENVPVYSAVMTQIRQEERTLQIVMGVLILFPLLILLALGWMMSTNNARMDRAIDRMESQH